MVENSTRDTYPLLSLSNRVNAARSSATSVGGTVSAMRCTTPNFHLLRAVKLNSADSVSLEMGVSGAAVPPTHGCASAPSTVMRFRGSFSTHAVINCTAATGKQRGGRGRQGEGR